MRRVWCLIFAGFLVLPAVAQEGVRVLIRDIASFEGVRENSLIGYGLVAGLKNTGDSQQTVFTNQTLANVLLRMGIQVTGPAVRVNNVAAVFVTASLPPFARSGTRLDVTVSSVGDAKSLEGGMLLLTTLRGPDGQVYATAQGPLTIGGFAASATGNVKQVNHPTVARIPAGAIVERDAPNNIDKLPTQRLLLASEDFSVAQEIAAAINTELNDPVASALDAGRVEILTKAIPAQSLPVLLARIETLPLTIHPRAKVVVNEHPQTIALILAHLDSKQGCALLMRLPEKVRAEAVRRLAQLRQFSPEMAQKVSLVLHNRLQNLGEQSRRAYAGFKGVADLLNRLDAPVAKGILEAIEKDDAKLAISIRNLMFTFEDLLTVPDAGIREVLGQLDKKTLALALKQSSQPLKDHIFKSMSSRAIDMLKEDMEVMGPVRAKDVQKAQQDAVAVARKLEGEGKLSLSAESEDEYVL